MSKEKFWLNSNTWKHIKDSLGNETGGVYVLKCNGEQDKPIAINRILDKDTDGILYIGMATKFVDRAITLKRSLSPEYDQKHACGIRYKSNEKFSESFPFDKLYLELHASDTPGILEGEMLSEYISKFGEVPPFNMTS